MVRASVRLVATDLDGTLLRGDGVCSGRTRAALAAVERAGIQVVLVTARPPRWLCDIADLVGQHGLALCCNGAFVYDVRSRQVLDEHCIAAARVSEIAADLRDALPGIAFAVESRNGFRRELGYLDQFTTPQDISAPTLEELLDPLPGKVLARCYDVPAQHFHRVVGQVVGDRAVVSYSGASGLAEISAVGVNKAAALGDWCTAQGFDSADVYAFGDMPNDLPMLRWAGRSFGVANAHPDVLDVVDEVCPSNEHDGVAQVLEALLADLSGGTRGTAGAGGSNGAAACLPGPRTYAGPRMSRSDGRVDAVIPGFRATPIAEERPGFAGQGDG
jgi:Cof subfamily protein (haloacid dehalogenase superfamily)